MAAERSRIVHTLRGRLLAALIMPLGGLFILGGVGSYALAQYFADTVYDGWLFDSVSALAQEVESTTSGPFVDMPASTQSLFEWDVVDKTYFRISSAGKGVLAGRPMMPPLAGDIDPYRGSLLHDLLADLRPDDDMEPPAAHEGALIYDGRLDGQEVRVARLQLPASRFGEAVIVEVAETTRKRRALAQAILLSTLVPQLLLIVAAGLTIRRAVTHGLQPLDHIAARLQTRSHRELSPLNDADVPEEVRPLTRSLNELLARLDIALAAQRRFIAEAAHQLRTPLTAIKLQAEEALREDNLDAARPLLLSLRQSTDRAVRLSNQLLSLARAEPDVDRARGFAPVDLRQLVQDTGAEWAPRALAAGIDMGFSAEDDHRPIVVAGDAPLLREALNNLIDNAIKYGGEGRRLHLHVAAHPDPQIVIEDRGPGIPAALRSRMLERFTRGESGEGSGLGLAIAGEIARLHRGELHLEEGPGGRGLRVRIRLPRAA